MMHSPSPELDYVVRGGGRQVRYTVVMRNLEEALISMWHVLGLRSRAWFELRREPDILILHYIDMVRHQLGVLRRIAGPIEV
jgi:hypothetical protein